LQKWLMKMMKMMPAALAVAATAVAGCAAAQPGTCRKAVGPDTSATYVRQCLLVSPATHPPCNPENPCDLIIGEIRRGCGLIHASVVQHPDAAKNGLSEPGFCGVYLAGPR
jgi:hypothetical protein